MIVSAIVAYSDNRAIGNRGAIPWNIPSDLEHFKKTTMGCPILMGRRTWQSIGRVLPGRRNIVVSRSLRTVPITRGPQPVDPSPELFKDIGSALASCQDTKELFVIGGGEIYARLLPWTDRVIATEVKGKYSGDTWFPPLYPGEWQMHKYDRQPSENGFEFAFVEYRRAGFHYPLSEGQS